MSKISSKCYIISSAKYYQILTRKRFQIKARDLFSLILPTAYIYVKNLFQTELRLTKLLVSFVPQKHFLYHLLTLTLHKRVLVCCS